MVGKIDENSNKSIIAIYNIVNQSYENIGETSSDKFFGFSGMFDNTMVYFEYITGGNVAVPINYKLYDTKTKTTETIDLESLSVVRATNFVDPIISYYKGKIYFEVQKRETRYNGNQLVDLGMSIYEYDITSKQVKELQEFGTSPTMTAEGLYFVEKSTDPDNISSLYLRDMQTDIITELIPNVAIYTYSDGKNVSPIYPKIVWKPNRQHDSDMDSLNLYSNGINTILSEYDIIPYWDLRLYGTYITWQQSGAPVYLYDIIEKNYFVVTDNFGANFCLQSEDFIYWTEAKEINYDNKNEESPTIIKIISLTNSVTFETS
ncbi:hypothetical protein [Culicoidibacter larvae]|uniref:Uncharacterized protein n=1 Tax=Culicoidibacter larvae TaxID=2579976 RepID=A0A5R8Q7A4_9FIRM|nr:hypothetical protein [Culicoidibacter larvae]TLG71300.1 hypothetical protein FEZ08_11155 [Culicoidibacter larvae]TLG71304.1 hypothetical protein FEZ08_11175 [Culicoidibacter larvae]